ncbi:UDP-2,3-diacylglucosamine diphosphatase [Thiobacillus sp.]|uniref:UDP-2,3-diacylglucosamine diphosphatase n=1 Tax=Thiobacillus sp. TaxID=924 RepID=UPI0011D66236|nr:UDP-2,3-diacylglucosamine diphosphatase [Thiobacillus sp.]MBD3812320.1 UDP-2,3-diacylglucosamine diphosphatase [Betaproteobacteria bacterium]TXH76344.1 MAG: UDP-2,3-diacylglucosamine diphosphatase [Thiobacillus sp.]
MSLTSKPGAGRTYFVADLHLTDERPAATGRFFRFLQDEVAGADALYILGDLFEAWIGDDHGEQVAGDTARRLAALATAGTRVYFMHGNRDFMLAERYAARSGMALIADPARIDLYGVPTLLMHGDALCTDDTAYQAFRRRVRHPLTRAFLRCLPRALRQRMARQARAGSEAAKAHKAAEIMDVNAGEVVRVLREYQACRLIHGHTHRPARHALTVDGHACERWVVPDWYTRWGYVTCDAAGCTLQVDTL